MNSSTAHLLEQLFLALRHVTAQLVHAKHPGHCHASQEGGQPRTQQSRHGRCSCGYARVAVPAAACTKRC